MVISDIYNGKNLFGEL